MTLLYILLAAIAAWLVYKAASKSSATRSRSPANAVRGKPTAAQARSDEEPRYKNNDAKDEWEGSFWEIAQPLPAKAKLRLDYTDGAGNKSQRTVDVRQFGAFGSSTLLIGHCLLRDATRTFRTDRVRKCIDEETGEVIGDIPAYLKTKYEESPERSRDALLEGEYDTLRVLLYVGKADGQLRSAEKAIIRETCVAIAGDSRLTDALIDELFANMDVPTLQAFKLAVGRITKGDATAQAVVLRAAERMVATQKTVHPSEQDALDYLRKRFLEAAPAASAQAR